VSDGLWRRQFAGGPQIIGRPIALDGRDYDVRPNDPWTLAAVSGGLAAMALAACWIPALRASRGDLLNGCASDHRADDKPTAP